MSPPSISTKAGRCREAIAANASAKNSLPAEQPWLLMEGAHHVRQALVVEAMELFGVGLPFLTNAVDVVERMPDLVAHDIR